MDNTVQTRNNHWFASCAEAAARRIKLFIRKNKDSYAWDAADIKAIILEEVKREFPA